MKGGIDTKQKDPYEKTRRAWDKRCLITVSTHLKLEDKDALDRYCKKHNTTPYNLIKAYLMDCVQLAILEAAQDTVKTYGGKRIRWDA